MGIGLLFWGILLLVLEEGLHDCLCRKRAKMDQDQAGVYLYQSATRASGPITRQCVLIFIVKF